MIISFKKILLTLLPIICFSSAFADKPLVEDILQSGALPTGSATLALIYDKNGASVTQSDLQGNSFWSYGAGINWNPSTTATDTVGNPWLKFAPAIPVHRKGQEGYSSFYDTTITVASTDDYKKITGLYGYKITINLTNDLNFGGETLPPLFNIVAFIGNYHTISDFSIIHASDYSGLLSTVSDSVCDLTLEINSFETTGPYSYLGVLVGRLFSGGKIKNCHVINNTTAGVVRVWGTSYLGGLVGYSEGTIDSCSVSRINVNAGDSCAGGLVGYTKGKISNCSVDTVTVTAQKTCVGGLVGLIEGVSDVKNCTVKNATVSGYTMVGGLIGQGSISSMTNCTVDTVTITIAKDYAGGLIGKNTSTSGSITSCTAKKVTISSTASGSFAGGLAGMFNGAITDCNVSEVDIQSIFFSGGGLVGQGSISSIANCTTNTVSISLSKDYAGGLVGNNTSSSTTGLITSCTARNVTIKSSGGSYVGGLTGKSLISISNCQASKIYIQGIYGNGGGLVGELIGAVVNCKVDTVSVAGGTKIGGLVGNNLNPTGTITNCAVDSVAVTATATDSYVGGLIGYNKATIDGCSANRVVVKGSSSDDSYAGGLVGQSNDKDVKNSKVTNGTISGSGLLGGLVGHTLSGSLYKDTVFEVTVTATNNQAGGLTSYLAPPYIVEYCEVKNCTISGKEKIAGLVGLSKGFKIANSKVMGGTVSGTSYIGGLVGYGDYASTSTTRCAVDNVTVTASGDNVGGLIGYNLGNISDCSVSRVPLSAHTYLGGIVGYSKGLVLRCLVTGTTITSTNTNAGDGFVAGVVGYNNTGWVKNCVAMIKYFDIKAKYTKNGEKFGRIVSNHGNLSQNYGWVETAIRYWHWRFGINWGIDYYTGTGQIGETQRNGENLFIGDKHYSPALKMAKESSFWTNIGFTSYNGWSTTDVGTKFYPQLTIVQGEDLGSIGTARGFEYEAHLIADNDGGDYRDKTVNIFTPQFFSKNPGGGQCAYFGNSYCNLYTDIELATEYGSGNSIFWSIDLNGTWPHNFTYSAIRLHDYKSLTFDGKGHSIINLHKEHSSSYTPDDHFSSGFFHAPNSDLTIKRLELEDPYVKMEVYYTDEAYVRLGFLVCESYWTITLEDIYVKKPTMYVTSRYPPVNEGIAFKNGYNGFVGTMIGRASIVNGNRLAVYMPYGSYMKSQYAHLGCLFGFIYTSISLDRIAVSIENSKDQMYSYVDREGRTVQTGYGTEGGEVYSQNFSMGYICAVGQGKGDNNDAADYTTGTKNFNNISLHDGHDGPIGGTIWNDYFPSSTFMGSLPFIFQVGATVENGDYYNCGGDYPDAGNFANTLSHSGISNNSNWIFTAPFDLKLNRDEYTENYQ